MKFFHFIVFLSLLTNRMSAQQNHFVYIQTENKQSFYIRMADRLLSSSTAGYLVIPKLQDGKYELGIGFPKNEWPLQKITISVKNDAGYILKNFDSKGWGLFNMQTMDIVMSSAITTLKDSLSGTKSDGFADVLADVVGTPSIKQKPVVPEINKGQEIPIVIPVSTVGIKNEVEAGVEKADIEPVIPVIKLFSVIESAGLSLVYVDTYDNKKDTIRILIPDNTAVNIKEKTEARVQSEEPISEAKTNQEVKTEAGTGDNPKTVPPVVELKNNAQKVDSATTAGKSVVATEANNSNKELTNAKIDTAEPRPESTYSIMTNSDCKANATGDDFLKLRKKMAAETSDDDMIAVAKKAFKSKCYSTEQVSNLSVLFLKDEGRYNFFDAAYPRVFDTHNFSGLINKLTEEYYITRFKAMIRH